MGTLKGICKWIIPVCEVVGMQVEQWWVCCRVNDYLEYTVVGWIIVDMLEE